MVTNYTLPVILVQSFSSSKKRSPWRLFFNANTKTIVHQKHTPRLEHTQQGNFNSIALCMEIRDGST
jgi:hypothetical protein